MKQSAGILILDPESRALFLKRSDIGQWALPGGRKERGETPWETAAREVEEETGYSGPYFDVLLAKVIQERFFLFEAKVPSAFQPRLNREHTAFLWRPFWEPPEPLHWGLRWLRK